MLTKTSRYVFALFLVMSAMTASISAVPVTTTSKPLSHSKDAETSTSSSGTASNTISQPLSSGSSNSPEPTPVFVGLPDPPNTYYFSHRCFHRIRPRATKEEKYQKKQKKSQLHVTAVKTSAAILTMKTTATTKYHAVSQVTYYRNNSSEYYW